MGKKTRNHLKMIAFLFRLFYFQLWAHFAPSHTILAGRIRPIYLSAASIQGAASIRGNTIHNLKILNKAQ